VTNDLQASASFLARKNPHHIPMNTPQVFSNLAPLIWQHLKKWVPTLNLDPDLSLLQTPALFHQSLFVFAVSLRG
jgi:hypothetical protein